MLRGNYRITITAKMLIFQMLIFVVGTVYGLMWKTYIYNKEWNGSIYHSVKIVANNKSYTLDNSKLIKNYVIESAVNKSANLEEKLSLYKKIILLKRGFTQPYNVVFNYDENYIKECIRNIEKDFNRESVNASVQSINNGNVKINPDIKGYKIDEDKLEEEIKKKINNRNSSDMTIEVPVIESRAAITKEKVSSINAKISSFVTSFSSSSYERVNNIELTTKLINGKLLMPGDIFSFNECVGERTKDRGFMIAAVLVGDKVDSGIGGGICQVSSTLYNAVLRAGIKPLEKTHHTLPPSYVELGLDSTVNWNDIDFKFKNTLNYPIYIEGYTEERNLYINIYSNLSLLDRKYVILSNVYETIYPVTKTVEDPNLSRGQTFSIQEAHNGYKVKVTRDTYENESLVQSEIISDEEYSAIPGITKIGQR